MSDGARPLSTDHLLVELERLRRENAALRRALRINGRHARRLQRAYDAALLLAMWHVAHLPTGRRAAMERGMSQRLWQNAMALLRLARVVDGAGNWQAHDLPAIRPALERARARAEREPEAFFARGPRQMRARRGR